MKMVNKKIQRQRLRRAMEQEFLLNPIELEKNEKYPKYPSTGVILYKYPDNLNFDKELDVVICIPSKDRYDLIIRLLNQFYTQLTNFKFQIILLNDGSSDTRYLDLINIYPQLIYIHNEKSNNKLYHWYCYNQMWDVVRKLKTKFLLQMDDDFLLSDEFLNNIINIYHYSFIENEKVGAVSPHLWSFSKEQINENWWTDNKIVDGIALIDINIIKISNYSLSPVNANVIKPGFSVGVWSQISYLIVKANRIINRTKNSLVYHCEFIESKLHGDYRINGNKLIYTKKYIGNL